MASVCGRLAIDRRPSNSVIRSEAKKELLAPVVGELPLIGGVCVCVYGGGARGRR